MTETRGIGRKALPKFICGARSRKITIYCSKSINWNIVKFLKSRYSENDHHFGETCMLRPHYGAEKEIPCKFHYLLSSTLFCRFYLSRQCHVVQCSRLPGEISYSWLSNNWNVRIHTNFTVLHTVTWWNTLPLWAQVSPDPKSLLKIRSIHVGQPRLVFQGMCSPFLYVQ